MYLVIVNGKKGPQITEAMAVHLHGLRCQESFEWFRHHPEHRLPYAYCYDNVRKVIKDHGGTMVTGWCVSEIGGHDGHALWRDSDGDLWEVCEEVMGWFIPDSNVQPNTYGCIFFSKRECDIEKIIKAVRMNALMSGSCGNLKQPEIHYFGGSK